MFIRLSERSTECGIEGAAIPVLLPVCNITGITGRMGYSLVYLKEEYNGEKCVCILESLDYIEKELNKLLKD